MSTKQQLAPKRRSGRLTPRETPIAAPKVDPRVDLSVVAVAPRAPPRQAVATGAGSAIPQHMRHEMIEAAAYRRAEARGFAPGHDVEDWLDAEREVDALIAARYG